MKTHRMLIVGVGLLVLPVLITARVRGCSLSIESNPKCSFFPAGSTFNQIWFEMHSGPVEDQADPRLAAIFSRGPSGVFLEWKDQKPQLVLLLGESRLTLMPTNSNWSNFSHSQLDFTIDLYTGDKPGEGKIMARTSEFMACGGYKLKAGW